MMQGGAASATLPPWLSPWSSGLLYGQRVYKGTLRERYRPRDRHRPRLTIYTYNHDDSQILRISGWGSADAGAGGGGAGGSNTARPLGWERYGLEPDPWRAVVPAHPPPSDLYRQIHIKAAEPPVGGEPPAAPAPADGGWGAARGWAAGTALLALLVVLARAAENCIDRKFFKMYSAAGARARAGRPRRRSEEWPTPNVLATSQQQSINERPETGSLPPSITVDLPPPYSECTSTAAPKPEYPEEPPPPYSDCYVEFSNKNGIPSVLIFSRRRNSILNRHEIVGSRDDAMTSDERTDDTQVVTLEDIRVDDRGNDVINELRHEVNINVERNDETAQAGLESAPDTSNVTINTDNVGVPEVCTVVVNANEIGNDNVKVV